MNFIWNTLDRQAIVRIELLYFKCNFVNTQNEKTLVGCYCKYIFLSCPLEVIYFCFLFKTIVSFQLEYLIFDSHQTYIKDIDASLFLSNKIMLFIKWLDTGYILTEFFSSYILRVLYVLIFDTVV